MGKLCFSNSQSIQNAQPVGQHLHVFAYYPTNKVISEGSKPRPLSPREGTRFYCGMRCNTKGSPPSEFYMQTKSLCSRTNEKCPSVKFMFTKRFSKDKICKNRCKRRQLGFVLTVIGGVSAFLFTLLLNTLLKKIDDS